MRLIWVWVCKNRVIFTFCLQYWHTKIKKCLGICERPSKCYMSTIIANKGRMNINKPYVMRVYIPESWYYGKYNFILHIILWKHPLPFMLCHNRICFAGFGRRVYCCYQGVYAMWFTTNVWFMQNQCRQPTATAS